MTLAGHPAFRSFPAIQIPGGGQVRITVFSWAYANQLAIAHADYFVPGYAGNRPTM